MHYPLSFKTPDLPQLPEEESPQLAVDFEAHAVESVNPSGSKHDASPSVARES